MTSPTMKEPLLGAFRDFDSLPQKKSCAGVKIHLTALAHRAYSASVKSRVLTAREVIGMLRKMQGDRLDSQFAADLGITKAYLCDLYKGRRTPGDKILSQLNLKKRESEPTYEVA